MQRLMTHAVLGSKARGGGGLDTTKSPQKLSKFSWPKMHSELSVDCLFTYFKFVSLTILQWKLVSFSPFFWVEGWGTKGAPKTQRIPEGLRCILGNLQVVLSLSRKLVLLPILQWKLVSFFFFLGGGGGRK